MPVVSLPDKNMVIEFPDDMDPKDIERSLYSDVYGMDVISEGQDDDLITRGLRGIPDPLGDLGRRKGMEQSTVGPVSPEDQASLKPARFPYQDLIEQASQKHKIGDVDLLRRMFGQESGFNPGAKSPKGAMGISQLMPGTAADLGVTDPWDPGQSIDGGARYIKQQLEAFGGDRVAALMAYNWGPGNMRRLTDGKVSLDAVPKETRDYVDRILGNGTFDRFAGGEGGYQKAAPVEDLPNNTGMAAEADWGRHNVFKDIGTGASELASGAVRGLVVTTPETYARVGRLMGVPGAENKLKEIESLGEEEWLKPGEDAEWQRWLHQGAESFTQSLGVRAPGIAVGLPFGPIGAFAGGVVTGAPLYALAEYDQFMEEAEKLGIPRDRAHDSAVISALAEGGFEAASDLVMGRILGFLGGEAKGAVKPLLTRWLTNTAKIMGEEVPTEAATAAVQAKARQMAGMPTPGPMEAALQSVPPTVVSSLGFGALGTGVQRRSGQQATDVAGQHVPAGELLEEAEPEAVYSMASEPEDKGGTGIRRYADGDVVARISEESASEINSLGFDTQASNVVIPEKTILHIEERHPHGTDRILETIEAPDEILPNIGTDQAPYRSQSVIMVKKDGEDAVSIVEITQGDTDNILWNFWVKDRKGADRYLKKFREEKTRILQPGGAAVPSSSSQQVIADQVGKPESLSGSQAEELGDITISSGTQDVNAKETVEKSTDKALAVPLRTVPAIPSPIPSQGKFLPPVKGARRSDIIEQMSKALEVPVRHKRFRERAEGIFKPKAKVIRLKRPNDVEVAMHEFGHHLERLLGLNPRMHQEVRDLAYSEAKNKNREGFAEFFRLYVTNESEARAKAPSFSAQFDQLLDKHQDVRDVVVKTRQAWENYLASPSVGKVMSFIRSGTEGKKRKLPTFNEVYQAIVDELRPLELVANEAEKKLGRKLQHKENPFMLAWLNRGWARKAEQYLKWGTFQLDEQAGMVKTGKSLRDILAPIEAAGERDLLDTYLVAKRGLNDQRIIEGFGRILPREDLEQTVRELEPKFKQVANELYQYNSNLLEYLVGAGRITQDLHQKIKDGNLFYTPLYRIIDDDTSGKGLSKKKFGNVPNPIKRLKGSSRDIYSPTESMLYNTYVMINSAERNRVGEAMIGLSKIKDMGTLIEHLPARMKSVSMSSDEAVQSVLNQLGLSKNDPVVAGIPLDLLPEVIRTFRPDYTTKGNEVIFYDRGEPEVYELAPDLHKAVMSMNAEDVGMITKIAAIPAKLLRTGATLTPEFSLRNPVRDQVTAALYSKYGYKPGFDMVRGIFHIIGKTDLYQQFNASGAANAAMVSLDRDYIGKSLEDLLRANSVGGRIKGLVRHPLQLLQAFSELTEEATRVGEFARGVEKEGTDLEGLLRSGVAGRDVTLDFSRIGLKTRGMNAITAFWNAKVQGTDKMIRAFRERPGQTMGYSMMGITLPTLLLWLAQHDDPYYQELPAWRKIGFWNIITHNPDGTLKNIWSIPKPFELGILFGSFPEMALNWAKTKDEEGIKQAIRAFLESFQPGVVPTGLIPLFEWQSGKSWFFDRPIVPRDKEGLKPRLQYGPHTSETMRLVADVMSKVPGLEKVASPAKLENLVFGYTAGLGRYGMHATDELVRLFGNYPPDPAMKWTELPGIRGFNAKFPSSSSASIEQFYRELDKARTDFESTKQEAGVRGMTAFNKDLTVPHPPQLKAMEQVAGALSLLRKVADMTYESKTMPPGEKRKTLDSIYLRMIDTARLGLGKKPIAQAVGE